MLTLPTTLAPDYVNGIEVPEYPVHKFTSDTGLEWRNIQSCAPTGAKLSLSWSKTTTDDKCATQGECYPMPPVDDPVKSVPCQVWEWWKRCRGTFRAFEIGEDHPLWSNLVGIDECYRDLYEPFNRWRFDKKPNVKIDTCGTYDVDMSIIQIPQCFTYG